MVCMYVCVCIYIYIHIYIHTRMTYELYIHMYICEWHIYSGILLSHEKEGNPTICKNMDGPWGHYAKWNKSDRERQILYYSYDLTYMWKLKKPKKKDAAHIYNGILLSHKKKQNWVICSEVDGPRDYHTKWRKSDRERQISYDIPYMWNLKKWYKWT